MDRDDRSMGRLQAGIGLGRRSEEKRITIGEMSAKRSMKGKLVRWGCLFFAGWMGFCGTVGVGNEPLYPKGEKLRSLVVIPESRIGSFAERVMVATLQGVVAKRSSRQIYVLGRGGYSYWKDWLCGGSIRYGIPAMEISDPWALLDQFQSFLDGYILYDYGTNPDSLNAATSLCGLFHAIAVDRSIEEKVREHGVTHKILDVSGWDEKRVWAQYAHLFHPRLVVEQKEKFDMQLRDYAVLARAFTFYDGNSAFRMQVLGSLVPDGRVLGWGDASHGEDQFVGPGSDVGASTLAADWALNLAPLSSVYHVNLFQRTYSDPKVEPDVHYVTFVVTDGDNVQWNLGGFVDYYNHPNRGEWDMGWAISPALADLAPSVMDWYYSHASISPHRDVFIAGPSGDGYFYPSRYPKEELRLQVQRLNDLMERGDLHIVQVLDFHSFYRRDLWDLYTAQPQIDGIFYIEYAPYDALHGRMIFSNNKPIVSVRAMLWKGISGADVDSVVRLLNHAVRDPYSPMGYSLIAVHVWSMDLEDVKAVVDRLDPHVRVVAPDAFVKLIRKTLGRLRFDFSDGLQGWKGGVSGKPYDRAEWVESDGNGMLRLDGSDVGQPDEQPNSWFSRTLYLPNDAVALRFRTKAVSEGRLRVRIQPIPSGASAVLMDWDRPTGREWKSYTLDLRDYAGKTVVVFFEQNDGGRGVDESRFVDDVEVIRRTDSSGSAEAPRLVGVEVSTNSVRLFWRPLGKGEDGYIIERRGLPNEDWRSILHVPADRFLAVDTEVSPGRSYLYRVRATLGADLSSPSSPRLVTVPQALIRPGSVWKYYARTFYPGPGWYLPDFQDQDWKMGPAPLGYGNGDEATVVRTASDSKYVTTYFRRRFFVVDPARVRTLIGRLLRDDGAVVYLNGTEVFRNNLPDTRIFPNTLAEQPIEGEAEHQFIPFAVDPNRLVPGWNVVAVEIHQATAADPDMKFDLTLTAGFTTPAPPLRVRWVENRVRITWPAWAEGFRLESTPELGKEASWAPVSEPVQRQEDQFMVWIQPTGGHRFFRLVDSGN